MPVGVPAEESVELYNRLTTIAPSDVPSLDRIIWRLRNLRRKLPSDVPLSVALIQALALRGRSAEAIELATDIFFRRQALVGDVGVTYGSVLSQLGMYDEAISFVGMQDPEGLHPVEVASWVHAAWGSGNAESLRAALRYDRSLARDAWTAIFAQMSDLGIMPYFRERQEIVRHHVFKRQCGAHLIFTCPGGAGVELTHYIYMDADHGERSEIADAIYDDFGKFYGERGLGGVDFWSCAPVIILNQTARLSLREESGDGEITSEAA
jgi:hypothetical protein